MENQRSGSTKSFRTILAAIDVEAHAVSVIEQAVRLAGPETALHIVHAILPVPAPASVSDEFERELRDKQMDEAREYVDRMGALASGLFAGATTVHLVRADASDGILRAAERVEADLIVVGTHDYRGVKRFLLGSVAGEVAKRACCPVFVARPVSYPATTAPAIEPVCPDCASVRLASAGSVTWCAQHATHHPRAHLHYEYPQGFGGGSQVLRV